MASKEYMLYYPSVYKWAKWDFFYDHSDAKHVVRTTFCVWFYEFQTRRKKSVIDSSCTRMVRPQKEVLCGDKLRGGEERSGQFFVKAMASDLHHSFLSVFMIFT